MMDNPLWRLDRMVVEGALHGRTCTVTLDGKDVTRSRGTLTTDSVRVMRDWAHNIGLDEGHGLKTIACAGVMLNFVGDAGTLPPPGRYVVAREFAPPPGWAGASLSTDSVSDGGWPLAWFGTSLEARSGEVVLRGVDSVSATGRFRFVARRRAGGP